MQRRAFIASCVAGTGALAGCSGILGDGSNDDDAGPASVAEAFLEALFAGNLDRANSYVHEDSEMYGRLDAFGEFFDREDIRLEERTVAQRQGDRVAVNATTSLSPEHVDARTESTLIVILVRVDGRWRVEMLTTPGFGGGGPSAPSVRWESRERTADDGETTAVVFEHTGGDTFEGSTLSVSVDDATASAPANADTLETGVQVVAPVDAAGSSIEAGTAVELSWSDPDSESKQTLASHVLGEATIGALASQITVE